MRNNAPIASFNGGEIGPEVQGRVHLEGYSTTASLLQNFLGEAAGPMSLRPGMRFLVDAPNGNFGLLHPFIYSVAQRNLLFFTANELRIIANDGYITRPSVSSSITNGTFSGSLTGWTNISAGGGSAAVTDGALQLVSNGVSIAGVRQQVSTSSTGVAHALIIEIERGPVFFRVGSSSAGDDYISTRQLRTGVYSLAFTPTGSYWIDIYSTANVNRRVTSVQVSPSGDMVLPTPWSASVLRSLRFDRKRDVVWINSGTTRKMRLERHGLTSWGLAESTETDGPFLTPNTDQGITLTPSVRSGNGTLTASRSMFYSTHVGSLWKIVHTGQSVSAAFDGEDQFSDAIRVTGVTSNSGREFTLSLSDLSTTGTTVTLQRSVGNDSSWQNVATYTTNGVRNITDALENQIVFYRVGVRAGHYSTGTISAQLSYAGGSTEGIAKAVGYVSGTQLQMEVVRPFAATTASTEWAEGAWSDRRGWPKAVALWDGRKWEGRGDEYWASVSGFNESYQSGDEAANAISREIDAGDANSIQWMIGMERLAIGTEGAEPMVRSNAFDEPVTPSNLTLREVGTYGSADVSPVKVDTRVLYVERSGWRVMELVYDVERQNYIPRSLMRFHKSLGRPGIVQMAVARQPDSRVYMVRSDGVCLVKLYEAADGMGWARLVTDGEFESVAVLPGSDGEDDVYFIVKRQVEGNDVRYLEKMDPLWLEDAADANRLDSYARSEGSPSTVLSGLDHLEGREVILWGDGAYCGKATVSGGQVTFPQAKAKRAAGLYYEGLYRSSKLAFGAQAGTALGLKGRPTNIAFLLINSTRAVEYGPDFDQMDVLADRSEVTSYDTGPGLVDVTTEFFPVPGSHSTDPRLCIRVQAPFPVTIQGYVLAHHLDERIGSN